MNILLVVAHPDDEVLMAGGSIYKWKQEGHKVHVAWVCENDSMRYGEATPVASQAYAVSEYLGFTCEKYGYPDQGLDRTSFTHIVGRIIDSIKQFDPDKVITHWHGDLNRDHRIVREAVMVATRPKFGCRPLELLEGYVATSSEWAFGQQFSPTLFEELDHMALWVRLKAMAMYETEIQPEGPRSHVGMEAAAKYWGNMVGVHYAEPFNVIRMTK